MTDTTTIQAELDPLDITGYSVLTVEPKVLTKGKNKQHRRRFAIGPCGHWVSRFRHESVSKKFAWCNDPCHKNRVPTLAEMDIMPAHVPPVHDKDAEYYPGKMVEINSYDTKGLGGAAGKWR